MKKLFLPLIFAAFAVISFSSCKKCFQCNVSNPVTHNDVYQEPEVTCGEKVDDHKSVLEQSYQCATCSEIIGNQTYSVTQCGTTESVDAWMVEETADGLTCSKTAPTINCYEAK